MVEEKTKKQTFIMTDVHSVFYKIIHSTDGAIEEKRFLTARDAQEVANETEGQVVKMTKRIVETMEMELVR